ncbi:MAG: DNA topoisomerase IB [Syntrophaceae bacterium]
MKRNTAEIFAVQCLRFAKDTDPGLRRARAGTGFRYVDALGREVTDSVDLNRIKSLAVPPAWEEVWIAPGPDSHLQATGRDQKGRKQYIYHPHWREFRSTAKFYHIIPFAEALPSIRERTGKDLQLPGMPRAKVLAAIIRLLEHTLIRIGNREYARKNRSFGLSTLQDRHLIIAGRDLMFHFHGKSGKEHRIKVHDRRLAAIVKRLHELPGHELFQYYDDKGVHRVVDSAEVNEYLHEITKRDFTAKEFRTWGGTVIAAAAFAEMGPFRTEGEAKRNVSEAIKKAAERLGNKPSICSKYYVHPAITAAYLKGDLIRGNEGNGVMEQSLNDLQPLEKQVLEIIREYENEMKTGNRGEPFCEAGLY